MITVLVALDINVFLKPEQNSVKVHCREQTQGIKTINTENFEPR